MSAAVSGALRAVPGARLVFDRDRVRAPLAADVRRVGQIALGLLWLLDGALQFQPFMYSRGFLQALAGNGSGQPVWLFTSINWAVHVVQSNPVGFDTLFALIQVAIGVGLMYRRTVRPALAASIAWALVVWWFGEGFGMLFMSMGPPLSGAPGAAALYAIIALIVWPGRPGGLLGARGARLAWAALWLVVAYLWLSGVSTAANSIQEAIASAPSGLGWLTSVQRWAAAASQGHGMVIALVLALVSASIGVAVAAGWWVLPFLLLSVALNLGYWVVAQGLGGILTGTGTDPNAGPLFVLLALVIYPLATDRLTPDGARTLVGGPGGHAQAPTPPRGSSLWGAGEQLRGGA